jgi:hypothetical protein
LLKARFAKARFAKAGFAKAGFAKARFPESSLLGGAALQRCDRALFSGLGFSPRGVLPFEQADLTQLRRTPIA